MNPVGRPKNVKGIEITCYACGNTWKYGGKGFYASCSKCHTPNRVPGREIRK